LPCPNAPCGAERVPEGFVVSARAEQISQRRSAPARPLPAVRKRRKYRDFRLYPEAKRMGMSL